jgi:RNA polymerase II subunit A small phosphatase-like protein
MCVPPLFRRLSSMESHAAKAAHGKRKTLLLPQRDKDIGKLTVILDMDETLIHSEFTGTNDYRQEEERLSVSGRRPPDFSITLYEGSTEQEEEIVHVYKRPGLDNFLKKLAEICEPVIFTAALPLYARPILKQIDPKRKCKSRLYRNATTSFRGYPHVKALHNLGRDLSRVILVDNSPFAMCADPDNALPIKAYYDDTEDRELEYLYEIVKELTQYSDVRPVLQRKFNFAKQLGLIMDLH